jgi:hypothetical protein
VKKYGEKRGKYCPLNPKRRQVAGRTPTTRQRGQRSTSASKKEYKEKLTKEAETAVAKQNMEADIPTEKKTRRKIPNTKPYS